MSENRWIFYTLSALLTLCTMLATERATAVEPPEAFSAQQGTTAERSERTIPPSFGKYRSELRAMASALAKDGRVPELQEIIKPRLDYGGECRACRAFFKEMAAALSWAEKEQQAVARQREPSVETIQRTVTLALKISENGIRQPEVVAAALDWNAMMKSQGFKTKGANDYFDFLATYIDAAFRELIEESRKRADGVAPATPTLTFPKPEEFFDF